jgi:hypothetical protein
MTFKNPVEHTIQMLIKNGEKTLSNGIGHHPPINQIHTIGYKFFTQYRIRKKYCDSKQPFIIMEKRKLPKLMACLQS